MIRIDQDDVLRGLKKFKRLAKQDLLASPLTSDPQFWSAQAEARRQAYAQLMELVASQGVDAAYEASLGQYAALPLLSAQLDPNVSGVEQALEMFFTLLAVDRQVVTRTRNSRKTGRVSGDQVVLNASS